MPKFKEDLNKCKEYENILGDIKTALSDAGIRIIKTSENELMVESDKEQVEKIIHSLPIPKVVLLLLIKVKKSKDIVYIRKKIK